MTTADAVSVLQPIFNEIQARGQLAVIERNPRLQFGTQTRQLKLAPYLPRRLSTQNTISEDLVLLEGHIADDGDPMSPPQLKSSTKGMPITVVLGHIDTAAQMSARDIREISQYIQAGQTDIAYQRVVQWLTMATRMALSYKEEKQRCEAIANGQVTITPMSGAPFSVTFPIPADNQVTVLSGTTAAPAGWYADDFNPILDTLVPLKNQMIDAGIEPLVCFTSNRISAVLESNQQITKQAGGIIIDTNGNLQSTQASVSSMFLDARMRANGLPPIMKYDTRYPLQDGSKSRFFPEDKFVMLGATGRQEIINWTEERELKSLILDNTLGYYGVGTSLGRTEPGTVIATKSSDLKPIGWYAEAYQESFPVLLDYDAVAIITIPQPTQA